MKNEDLTYFMSEISGIYKDRRRFVAHSMSFVRIEAVAEDIYSDSIMKILEKKENFVAGDNVRGYFHRVLLSKSYDYVKRKIMLNDAHQEIRNAKLRDAMYGILSERESDSMAFLTDLNERIGKCRSKMSGRCYEIFSASSVDGLTHKEIAEKYSMTIRQVTTEIQRALEIFRAEFGDLLIFVVMLAGLK